MEEGAQEVTEGSARRSGSALGARCPGGGRESLRWLAGRCGSFSDPSLPLRRRSWAGTKVIKRAHVWMATGDSPAWNPE